MMAGKFSSDCFLHSQIKWPLREQMVALEVAGTYHTFVSAGETDWKLVNSKPRANSWRKMFYRELNSCWAALTTWPPCSSYKTVPSLPKNKDDWAFPMDGLGLGSQAILVLGVGWPGKSSKHHWGRRSYPKAEQLPGSSNYTAFCFNQFLHL